MAKLSSYLSHACPGWRRSSKPPAGMSSEGTRSATYLRNGNVVIRCSVHGCYGYRKRVGGDWGYGAYVGGTMREACNNVTNTGAKLSGLRSKKRRKSR